MLSEYLQVSGYRGDPFSIDYAVRVIVLIFCGLALTGIGYRLKGTLGAIFALAIGVLFFLYNERIIRFW